MDNKAIILLENMTNKLKELLEAGRIDTKNEAPIIWGMIEDADALIYEHKNK